MKNNQSKTSVKNTIIKEVTEDFDGEKNYPYCEIPPHYFDCALKKPRKTPLFTVETWEGRSVFSVKRTEN